MQKNKVIALLAAAVIIGGIIFAWYNLSGKTEQGSSKDTEIVQVEETEVAEEEVEKIDFSLVESDSEIIVLNDTKIRKEPKLTSEEIGTAKKDSILAVEYSVFRDNSFDGWVQVTVDGVTGYIQDFEYHVAEEVEEEVVETEQTEEVAEETTESIVAVEEEPESGVSEEKPEEQPVEEAKTEPKPAEPKQEAKKEEPKPAPATPEAPVQSQDEAQQALYEETMRKLAEMGAKTADQIPDGVANGTPGTGQHYGNAE